MADPAAMGATTPDGIAFLMSGSPINPVSESAQQASTVQSALAKRTAYSYSWTNDAARKSQSGMREGDTGYQKDTDQPYWYFGSTFGWCPVLVGHASYGGGRVLSGSVLVTPTGSGSSFTGHADINLPVGYFNSPPIVQVSIWSANPLNVGCSYSAPTAAGFTVYLGRTDGAFPSTISWTAAQ